jgi:hypothetical protein
MTENVVESLQKLIQDVIAPDLRELKVELASFRRETAQRFDSVDQRFDSLEKRMEQRFVSVDQRFDSLEKQSEAQYREILAEIRESRTHGEVVWQEIANLRERVAVLEAAQARKSSKTALDR